MARDFKRTKKLDAISEMNVTPLIDLAFSLLIIFMITTPLMEQNIRVDLPFQSRTQELPPEEEKSETISILGDESILWGDRVVTKVELGKLLDKTAKADPFEQPTIHVKADRGLKWQQVVDVIDMIKVRKLKKLSLDTQAK
ncbi:uncharacterized protein METZ01_LOCUS446948 [marine metagenome]|uniref:Biopolymer transporter ExbD n=1 Tax=marine metagenome TaxID=408172 RepID=A0A382ZEY6_9ZZZZ